jgi:hypothetical protein
VGHSQSIDDLQKQDKAFQDYLNGLEQQLKDKAKQAEEVLTQTMQSFYTNNKYDDAVQVVSGKQVDFIHETEFTLDNLKAVVDGVAKVVFSTPGSPPPGTNVDKDGVNAVNKGLGPMVGEIANLELYIAGKVFDLLSNAMLSFGTTTGITYNTVNESKSLGYGLQMFTTVAADAYRTSSFFHNETINEYLYSYEVRFSLKQANKETQMTLVELYQDQIATFKHGEEDLLNKLSSGELSVDAYEAKAAAYDKLIEQTEKKLQSLKDLSQLHATTRH